MVVLEPERLVQDLGRPAVGWAVQTAEPRASVVVGALAAAAVEYERLVRDLAAPGVAGGFHRKVRFKSIFGEY